ncbi:PREDICTED: centrosomal protein of 126 kDa isoform X2 [Chinchilla lanigera]|uniref:centrosomal protein of 126 kDa isoform X2 n=1 Tax=Chinchilla lanigera TaxID=34839 RepID=UPI000695D2B6|nr:PREDICTED: centrosomal protein of 126 kDa isoform X2 [Chinchilla lanigera]
MPAGRPGAQSAGPGRGAECADGPGGAPRGPGVDMKIHLEKNLEEERQILLQQQKMCRNRARKYFVESNRRKKAFEEKRKEHEEREHQIREQILQQRKQKFEEVTEKFQRAHVPLSQRRRAVFHKPVPPLEEALKQIQESDLKSEVHLPFSHRPTMNWRAVDSALPSALSKNDHRHHKRLFSKINWDTEMKENNVADLATNKNVFQLKLEETQKLLEDQHLSSLQRFCDEVKQITNSETLSSADSLEAGEREEIHLTLTEERSAAQQNSVPLRPATLQSAPLNCCDEDKLSFSKAQRINNWLTDLDAQNTWSVTPSSDILSKSSVLPPWEHFNNKEENASTLGRTVERATSTPQSSGAFVYSPPVIVLEKKTEKNSEMSPVKTNDFTSGALKRGRPLVTATPAFKSNKAWATPDSQTREVAAFPDQGKYCGLTQQNRTTLAPASFVPVATPLVLSSSRQSARPLAKNIQIKEIDPVQCSDKLEELKDVTDEKMQYFNYEKKELPLFSDSFQAVHIPQNSDSKDKQKIAETSTSLCNVISHYDLLEEHRKMKCSSHQRSGVKFLKSILKKDSKYEHDYLKALFIKPGFKFRNQKAAAIRDSIELTKEKEKGVEILKTAKKLRWFDETLDKESSAEDTHSRKSQAAAAQPWSQQAHSKSAGSKTTNGPACAVNSADRNKSKGDAENVSVLGSGTDHVPSNCFIPSDYNLTKQAWPASKEESVSPGYSSDLKTQRSSPQRGGARVSRRTGSADVQSGFIDTNRKGPVIPPQPASKANAFMQAQGTLMPHPPPNPGSNIRSSKSTQVSQCHSATPQNSPNIITHDCFNSKYVLPTEHRFNQWNQESGPPLSDACSDLVTVIPSLPSYYSSECQTLAKSDHAHSAQMAAQQHGTLYCTQRTPVHEESYQPVTLKTTEQGPTPSWKRGNNVLHQNERAIDSTVRRKRIVENKQRNLSVQKRKNPGSAAQRNSEQVNNFGQTVQLSSSEPRQTTRGTNNIEEDSTSEFLMAENLVKVSVPEDKILTVLSNKQLQKSNLALNKTQQFNICALSAEEQRILQSLDRLNERLHYVQETICKNPSIKSMLHIIPFLNSQPKASPAPDVGSRLQRRFC